MAFSMGALLDTTGDELRKPPAKPYKIVQRISLADGWAQILSGLWEGIGLLEVQEPCRQVWGSQVFIVDDKVDRLTLRREYPEAMIFLAAEFTDAMTHWPGNEGVILAKRFFSGEIF